MPRSIWRGVLSFGMVAIPVRLYLATESSSKVSFNLLCPEHKSRIKNKRWCPEGDHEVAWGDVVRGYEYEKGSYVILTDEDPRLEDRQAIIEEIAAGARAAGSG